MLTIAPPPEGDNPRDIIAWAYEEMSKMSAALDSIEAGYFIPLSTAPPTKLRGRTIAFADGTHWNPGSGRGLYFYYDASWHFIC